MSEVMHPPLAPAPDRILIPSATLSSDSFKSGWFVDAQIVYDAAPSTPSHEVTAVSDFSEIQKKVKREWLPVRGNVDPSDLVDVFAYKSSLLALELLGLSTEQSGGDMDNKLKSRLVRKIINVQVGCIDILTEYGHDANKLVEEKLNLSFEKKYPADSFTELRLYGPPDAPGRMSVREAARYLKNHFDKETKIQQYEFRGLPVPDEEERARFADLTPFGNWQQLRVAEWQVRAFGSDFSVGGSIIPNMLGEYEEFMAEFDSLTPQERNAIKFQKGSKKWENIGEEGADFLISSMGVLAAWEVCVQRGLAEKVDRMKHDFKKAPQLRAQHKWSPSRALREIAEQKHRLKHNLKPTYKSALLLNIIR